MLYETREGVANDAAEVLFSTSTDYGETWQPEIFLSSTDSLVSDESFITADTGGNVYVVWRDAKYGSSNGFGATIILRCSDDYGKTWQSEKTITTLPTGLLPTVSLNEDVIGVVWQDETPGIRAEIKRIHCRISFDRGGTWTREYDVTEQSNNYNLGPAIAVSDGCVHVAWSDTTAGNKNDIFYRRGRIYHTGVERIQENLPKELSISPNYPNPFNGQTRLQLQLPKAAEVKMQIYDFAGRYVATLVNEIYLAGEYTITWDASGVSSGVYLAVLQADNKILQRKIIVMK